MLSLPRTQASRNRAEVHRHRPEVDEVGHRVGILGELPDRQGGAVERQRRDDGVDPGAVGQAGVDHGARLVDAPADGTDDLVDHLPVLAVVGEGEVGRLDDALPLHPDLVVGVAHDLGDGRVGQRAVEGAVAEDVGENLGHELRPLDGGDADVLPLQGAVEGGLDLPLQLAADRASSRSGGGRGRRGRGPGPASWCPPARRWSAWRRRGPRAAGAAGSTGSGATTVGFGERRGAFGRGLGAGSSGSGSMAPRRSESFMTRSRRRSGAACGRRA